jgi:hypothetical protein
MCSEVMIIRRHINVVAEEGLPACAQKLLLCHTCPSSADERFFSTVKFQESHPVGTLFNGKGQSLKRTNLTNFCN